MGTPDGILSEDWDHVHELALAIVNAAPGAEKERERQRLFDCLDELGTKYGERPSLLATRADYQSDRRAAERLFRRAYQLAQDSADVTNRLFVAHSLASLFIEDLRYADEGATWLRRLNEIFTELGESLREIDEDGYFVEDYRRLVRGLMRLSGEKSEGEG
jgi:hypothetical protein